MYITQYQELLKNKNKNYENSIKEYFEALRIAEKENREGPFAYNTIYENPILIEANKKKTASFNKIEELKENYIKGEVSKTPFSNQNPLNPIEQKRYILMIRYIFLTLVKKHPNLGLEQIMSIISDTLKIYSKDHGTGVNMANTVNYLYNIGLFNYADLETSDSKIILTEKSDNYIEVLERKLNIKK